MAINREISQFSNFVSVDDNTKKVSISTSFDIGGDSVVSGDLTVGTATTGVVSRTDGTLNVSGVSTFRDNVSIAGTTKGLYLESGPPMGGGGGRPKIRVNSPTTPGIFDIYVVDDTNVQYVRHQSFNFDYNISVDSDRTFIISDTSGSTVGGLGVNDSDIAFKLTPESSTELRFNRERRFETTTDGFKVLNGTSETAVISGPQNIILDPSPDDVVAIVEGDISATGVSTITGITTTNIAVGNLIQEVDGVISAGTTVTSVGASQVGISKTSLGSATNQEFTFANQTPTGIVRVKGDLYIDGTRTEINSTTLTVDDLNVVVASGASNGLTADTAGLTVDGANAYLKYNYNAGTNETWELNKNVGIGTDNATAKLDVDGTLNVSGVSTFQDHVVIGVGKSIQIGPTGDQLSLEYDTNGLGLIRQNSQLFLLSPSTQITNLDGSKTSADFFPSSSVNLYHNGTTKFQTTSSGISVIGRVETSGLNVSGISTFYSDLDIDADVNVSGIVTAQEFIGNGGGLRGLKSTELVTYASASDISNSALSISGISTYNEVGILTGTYATDSGDRFGWGVACSADGNTIIVSADTDETGSTNSTGVVYVYDRVGNTFNEVGILTGSYTDHSDDTFGYKVATSADGKTIIISDLGEDLGGSEGVVYVFDRVGNNFNQVGILTGSLAASNNNNNGFGFSVATSADGKTIIVGDATEDFGSINDPGVVYVYDRVGNNFNEVGILTGSNSSSSSFFGFSVATSADGKTIIVGASNDDTNGLITGAAYVFDRVGNNFNEVGILTGTYSNTIGDFFGNSVTCSADGKTIVVGAREDEVPGSSNSSGVVYVFDRVGNNFNEVGILTGSYASNQQDRFGKSVATSADGKTIVVGAWDDAVPGSSGGVVYTFNRQGDNFNQVGILTGSASSGSSQFGGSVAISADGKNIIVGAHGTGTGSAYVFDEERETYVFSDTNGNIGIGSAQPTAKLDINGTLNVSGISTFYSDLDIDADVNVSGIVTARSFVGSGELLTNLDAYAAYTSDRSTLATIADKISGIATYSEDQGFNYLGGNESYHANSFWYGADIEASDDGKVMFVSSIPLGTGDQAGCGVQIYERTNSNFNYVGFVTSLSHHTLGVGQTIGDLGTWFGPTLASNADGSIFVVASPGTNPNYASNYEYGFFDDYNTWEGNHGYINIFQKTGNNIEPLGIITAPPADTDNSYASMFGHAVALNADGTKLYVSAPGISTDTYGTLPDGTSYQLGLVYAYNKVGTSYQQVGVITSHRISNAELTYAWGHRVVCSDDGDTIYISGPKSHAVNQYDGEGIVEVYSRIGNTISHVGILTHGYDSQAQTRWQNSHFGISMDCSSDGDIVAIAARPNHDSALTPQGGGGALFVFEKTGTNTFTKIAEEVFDRYSVLSGQVLEIGSFDLRVNSDASTIVMSASQLTGVGGGNPGGHFVAFSRDGGNISRIGNFTPLASQAGSWHYAMFGSRLAIDSTSDNVFVGAPIHALGSTSNSLADKGSAYVFNVSRQIALHSNQITGNIGIGTDNPTSSLDVNGTLNVSGISTFQDDVSIGTGGTTAFFDVSSGRVGIGITNPTKLLDIDGTLGVSGISYFTNAVSIQPSNSSTVPLNFKSRTGFVPQIFFNRISTSVGYGIHYFIGAGSTGHAIHQLDIGSNFEIGLNGGSFIVGDNTFGGFPVTTKAFEVKEDAETYLTHNHDKKLETTGYGVTVTGGLNVSGIATAAEFVGGGSDLRNLSGTHLVSYASASDISNSALSISGISTYNEVGILTGSNATELNDNFGLRVATSADGKTIVVGAAQDETSGTGDYGVVYVYDREGNNFNEVGILTGTYASDSQDRFGSSVATSADGKTIVVSAYNDEVSSSGIGTYGVVYVFDREGNNFNEVGILTGSYASDSQDRFGLSVATSADGKTIIVGAISDETSGSGDYGLVYVFDRVGDTFTEVGILTGTYASHSYDLFGRSVATSADGKTIIVGASGDQTTGNLPVGLVYVFNREGNNFNQVGILTGSSSSNNTDYFGHSVATSADGKTIVVGSYVDEINLSITGTGIVYVFDREGNNFNEVGILTGTYATDSADFFGSSVATSADGKTIVVGAYNDETSGTNTGVVYVFNREGNNFNEVGILTGSYASDYEDRFGYDVACSADGKNIIVGAYQDETSGTGTGVVYVFDQERETYVFSDADGNIGIGAAQPTAKLDVNGTLNVSGITTAESYFGSTDQNFIAQSSPTGIGTTNVIIGHLAGITTFTGVDDKINSSVLIGERAGNQHREITNSVVIGKNNLSNVTSDDSVIIGRNIGIATDGAVSNHVGLVNGICIGRNIFNNTTKQLNYSNTYPILIGENILSLNVEESSNSQPNAAIVIGLDAAKRRISGNWDIYIGYGAGQGTENQYLISNPNIGLGGNGSSNIMLGFDAGRYMSRPERSIVIGHIAGTQVAANDNVIIGGLAGYAVTTGASNILIGAKAGYALTEGSQNIVIGSGPQTINGNLGDGPEVNDTSGDKQLVIGAGRTDRWISGDSDFNIGIGHTYGDTINAKLDVKGKTELHQTAQGSQAVRIYGSTLFTSDSSLSTVNPTPTITVGSDYRLSGDYVPAINYVGVTTTKENLNIASPGDRITGINTDDLSVGMQVLQSGTGGQYIEPYTFIESIGINTVYLSKNHTATTAIGVDFSFKAVEPREDLGNQYEKFDTLYVNAVDGNTATLGNIQISSGIITATSGIVTYHGDGSQLSGIDATSLKDSNGVIRAQANTDGTISIGTHSIVSITTSHTSTAGISSTIDTFATSENDLAEYTIHVGYGNTIQAQKVLVMHDGTTAYSQEYAVMSQPSKIVSIEALISGSNVLLRATPETGVSGITTYKIVRGGLV